MSHHFCMLVSYLSAVSLVLVSLDVVLAVKWEAKNYPDPQRDLDRCGRKGKQSFVCDPDGIITYDEANDIDKLIDEVRKSTGPCICGKKCPTAGDYRGFQPAVALLNEMYIKSKSRKPTSKEKRKAADDFSDDLRDDYWEYGRCNDDFVILIAKQDRQVYTAVGDQARKVLTDSCVNTVFNDNKGYFSTGKWAKGIKEMLLAYRAVFNKDHRCNKPAGKWTYIILGLVGATGLGSCCLVVFLRQKYGICKSCDSPSSGRAQKYSSPSHHHKSSRRGSNDSSSSGGGGGEF